MWLTSKLAVPTLPAVEIPHRLAPMARGRPRAADPHVHGHWTKLTSAQESVWQDVLRRLGGGAVFVPQDSRALRYAIECLAKSLGFAWPDPEHSHEATTDAVATDVRPSGASRVMTDRM